MSGLKDGIDFKCNKAEQAFLKIIEFEDHYKIKAKSTFSKNKKCKVNPFPYFMQKVKQ